MTYYPLQKKFPFLRGKLRQVAVACYSYWTYRNIYYAGLKKSDEVASTKFFIVCMPRSGSSLLGSFMSGHPYVHWDNERFHANFAAPRLLANGMANQAGSRCYGIKLFLHQLEVLFSGYPTELPWLNALVNQDDWRIISLVRHNLLRHALSIERWRQGGPGYILKGEKNTKRPLTIDIPEFLNLVKWLDGYSNYQTTIMSQLPHLSIAYEVDLLDSSKHDDTITRIYHYLDLPSQKTNTPHIRQSSSDWRDGIENYREFERVVSSSIYQKYL